MSEMSRRVLVLAVFFFFVFAGGYRVGKYITDNWYAKKPPRVVTRFVWDAKKVFNFTGEDDYPNGWTISCMNANSTTKEIRPNYELDACVEYVNKMHAAVESKP